MLLPLYVLAKAYCVRRGILRRGFRPRYGNGSRLSYWLLIYVEAIEVWFSIDKPAARLRLCGTLIGLLVEAPPNPHILPPTSHLIGIAHNSYGK
jgi:hypothetical protein